jgi:S1-C subfamily serine protease
VGTGSGFLVDETSVITNRHVVDGAIEVDVNLWDGRTVKATVTGALKAGDIAFAELQEPVDFTFETNEEPLSTGTEVTAVGFPGGGPYTVTYGEVLGREGYNGVEMYRISNEIRPGNSGGPLLDDEGRVVGINTLLDTRTDEGLSIAIDELSRLQEAGTDQIGACEYKYL